MYSFMGSLPELGTNRDAVDAGQSAAAGPVELPGMGVITGCAEGVPLAAGRCLYVAEFGFAPIVGGFPCVVSVAHVFAS